MSELTLNLLMAYASVSLVSFAIGLYCLWITFTERDLPWAAVIVLSPVWPAWIIVLYYLAIKDLRKRSKK